MAQSRTTASEVKTLLEERSGPTTFKAQSPEGHLETWIIDDPIFDTMKELAHNNSWYNRVWHHYMMMQSPERKENQMTTYNVFQVVFVKAPTKTEEEQGVGATLLGGPFTVVATGESAAVSQATLQLSSDAQAQVNSSLVYTKVRLFD